MSGYKSKVISIIDFALEISNKSEISFINRVVESVSIRTGLPPSLCIAEIKKEYPKSEACKDFSMVKNHLLRLKEKAALTQESALILDVSFNKKIEKLKLGADIG